MKTIKVIDLLNKIANGEEVPKKIKIGNSPFELILSSDGKHYSGNTDSVLNNVIGIHKLNDEVEIIEEDKKIDNLKLYYSVDNRIEDENALIFDNLCMIIENQRTQEDKINELIDKINEMESKNETNNNN